VLFNYQINMPDTQHPAQTGNVTISLRGKALSASAGKTLDRTLLSIGLQPLAYLAVRGDDLLTADEILKPGDEIRLVAVVSGG
jgi:sulfur carrier protein ThiS